jgi:hypothetical protein
LEPERYPLRFTPNSRALLAPLGVVEPLAYAKLGEDELSVRFGAYTFKTPLSNIVAIEQSGPYKWWRALGVRMSLKDRGLTLGSATDRGVCLRFGEPAPGPLPGIRHPGLTIMPAEPEKFINALRRFGARV